MVEDLPAKRSTFRLSKTALKKIDISATYAFLILGSVLMIIPLVWMLFSALKTPA